MVQTDLKSDNFCGYNTSAAPFYWILDPVQNNVQFNAGEVGVPTGVGLHTPGEVIKVSNFLSDRDNYLTSCTPPVPAMLSNVGYESDASLTNSGPKLSTQGFEDRGTELQKLHNAQFNRENMENLENLQRENKKKDYSKLVDKADGTRETLTDRTQFLLPEVTNQKRSATDYSAVDWQAGFSGNPGNLYTDEQDLTTVIERMWVERGGLDQNQVIKKSYEPWTKNTYKDGPNGPISLNGKEQMPTCEKIRKPYDTKYPFGIPINPVNGEQLKDKESYHFSACDVESLGNSSPIFDQDPRLPFNYNAVLSNGGCNKVSFLKDNNMCQNNNNDLTGINDFNFKTDIPPPGVWPIRNN